MQLVVYSTYSAKMTIPTAEKAFLTSLILDLDPDPVLIITTHASLTDRKKWDMLPEIDHCHYEQRQESWQGFDWMLP